MRQKIIRDRERGKKLRGTNTDEENEKQRNECKE